MKAFWIVFLAAGFALFGRMFYKLLFFAVEGDILETMIEMGLVTFMAALLGHIWHEMQTHEDC